MAGICTTGDIGVGYCSAHHKNVEGVLIASGSTVMCNGKPTGLVGDIVVATCGHIGITVTGSSTVTAQGIGVVRVDDAFAGTFTGVMISGSSNVVAGG